jgi:hypothetical protein
VDVTKTLPLETLPARPSVGSAPQAGSQLPATAAATDRADIRPLDIAAALQILLAETRASFELTTLTLAMTTETTVPAENRPQAARAVVEVFLRAIPQDTADSGVWTAAVAQAEAALHAGLDRAIATISTWREVPAMVVDAAKETQAQIFSALADDPQNPAWARPEWAGLAPRLQRFWRRRRLARRQLTDPDYPNRSVDDNDV